MSDEIEETEPAFEPYDCSLGTVTGVEGDTYIVTTITGKVIGIAANGEPTAENVEADIASPRPVLATPEQIKTEAHRRILEIVPMWKQNNLTAVALDIKTKDSPTAEDTAKLAAIQAIWDRVVAIRAYSDTLEANPPPIGQLASQNWPT